MGRPRSDRCRVPAEPRHPAGVPTAGLGDPRLPTGGSPARRVRGGAGSGPGRSAERERAPLGSGHRDRRRWHLRPGRRGGARPARDPSPRRRPGAGGRRRPGRRPCSPDHHHVPPASPPDGAAAVRPARFRGAGPRGLYPCEGGRPRDGRVRRPPPLRGKRPTRRDGRRPSQPHGAARWEPPDPAGGRCRRRSEGQRGSRPDRVLGDRGRRPWRDLSRRRPTCVRALDPALPAFPGRPSGGPLARPDPRPQDPRSGHTILLGMRHGSPCPPSPSERAAALPSRRTNGLATRPGKLFPGGRRVRRDDGPRALRGRDRGWVRRRRPPDERGTRGCVRRGRRGGDDPDRSRGPGRLRGSSRVPTGNY